jgi:mannose-6-phosphate isomerase
MNAFPVRPARVYRFYRGGALIARLRGEPEDDDTFPEDYVGSATAAVNPGRTDPTEGLAASQTAGWFGRWSKTTHTTGSAPTTSAVGSSPGLLVKLLDSAERLPVHAHPSREFARRQLGSSFG